MQRLSERNKEMRIRLLRPYQTKPKGAVLNTVPPTRAKRMIENGLAILIEEPVKNKKERKADNEI